MTRPAPVSDTTLVTIGDLESAARTLAPVAVRTPLLPADAVSDAVGAPIWIKPEMLQRGGAFKFRGAYNFLSHMDPEVRKRGVIAPSSGNHAQAVAIAAKLFGIPATVVMPTTVTDAKRRRRATGARVVLAGRTTADRLARAEELMQEEGLTLVPPYDHPLIIAGQGTVGLEIAADLPNVDAVLVPVGGGGFSAGVSSAIKLRLPNARVIGVSRQVHRSSRAQVPVPLERPDSPTVYRRANRRRRVRTSQRFLDDVVTVDDDALARAMRMLLDRMKLVVEPSGAITVAALLERKFVPRGPTVAVLSGGNIEWNGLCELLGG
jgi:threonine dehydratase